MKPTYRKLLIFIAVFVAAFYIPFGHEAVQRAIIESFHMLQEYAREHVLFCLIPAFFIAGAIANFISQQAVIKYFGAQAPQWLAYSLASVSGTVLAVCSCTVLPLFAGIYRRGAGIGPATAFLYSGPAINILAIVLTARVLGWQLGLARAVGAIVFALVIGLLMSVVCPSDQREQPSAARATSPDEEEPRTAAQNLAYFATMVLILIFATWSRPEQVGGLWHAVFAVKWFVVVGLLIVLFAMLHRWFERHEIRSWINSTWEFTELITPLLFAGVLVAGFLMGRPEAEAGLIPAHWVGGLVGGNSLLANLTASFVGAFMYFATLTEIPIMQGLLGLGMGQGPALALLLAGPALSLPNMLVIRSVLGTRRTAIFVCLVVIMATLAGMIYGNLIA